MANDSGRVSHVALFRNLNQGQRLSPASALIASAFSDAGATDVRLVRGNGTVVFDAPDPEATAQAAAQVLKDRSPWDDAVFVRPLGWLFDRLIDASSFDPDRTEMTFFAVDVTIAELVPIDARRCRVVEGGAGFAITVNMYDRVSDGTPTVERALGVRATSRSMGTLLRL